MLLFWFDGDGDVVGTNFCVYFLMPSTSVGRLFLTLQQYVAYKSTVNPIQFTQINFMHLIILEFLYGQSAVRCLTHTHTYTPVSSLTSLAFDKASRLIHSFDIIYTLKTLDTLS